LLSKNLFRLEKFKGQENLFEGYKAIITFTQPGNNRSLRWDVKTMCTKFIWLPYILRWLPTSNQTK